MRGQTEPSKPHDAPGPPPEAPAGSARDLLVIEHLARRARDQPERAAFAFAGREHTYGAIWQASGRFSARLAARGVGGAGRPGADPEAPGDRVVLVLPNGPDFFAAFYGAQRAGAIPVPIFPQSGIDRVARLAALCGASLVVLDPETPPESLAAARERIGAVAGTGATAPAVISGLEDGEAPAHPVPESLPPALAERPALIQYTSGSTGAPKGVVITHGDLRTNVWQMIEGMEITAEDVFVSWLPVHHDMGLILMTMVPFTLGARLVLLPSSLGDVRAWLRAITEHRGTFTAAPDFAYRLCLRAVRDPSGFDLSSLRVALDAAEPVRPSTIAGFERAFGLDRVVVAGYGLAEATVGVSMQPPGTAPVVSRLVSAGGLVSIGRPFPGVRLRIVERADEGPGKARDLTEPGATGEIVVESPALTRGYFRDPKATAATFWARPAGTETDRAARALRTGDLGYRDAGGNVFVVGRIKNIILQAGRNLAPQEIEEAAETLPFVRRAAAVGIDRGGIEGEQAYVFAELRRARPPSEDKLHEMATEMVARIHERLGLRPGRVFLLSPRAIPRTANGKIRYPALRAAYLDGSLDPEIVFPPRHLQEPTS